MARSEKVFRATILVTLIIIVSKVFGFARDMITANYFGTGIESDAYTSAYSIFYLPVLLFNSCLTSTIVPLYVQARTVDGPKASNRFASNTFNLFGIAALVVSAIMYMLSGPLDRLVFSGFSPEKMEITIKLTRIMMLSLVFNVISIIMSSILNAREKFVAAQLTGFPLSLAVMIAAIFFSGRYGITAIAWGVFASGILQVLVQIPFFAKWFTYTPRIDLKDERFKRLMVLALPAILSMAVSELNHMIDHWLASSLQDGAIAALSYAYRLITFIIGILVVPINTVMFSKMSKLVSAGDTEGTLATVRKSIEVLSMILVPVIIVCAIMSTEIIRFAYGSGRFDESSIILTAGPFLFYVIGVFGFGIRELLNRTFHSIQDTKTPFRVACVAVIANIILNFILRKLMGINGLALATTISGSSAMVILLILLRKRLGRIGLKSIAKNIVKILAGGVVCGVVCVVLDNLIPAVSGRIMVLFRLAAIGGVSLICYAASLIVFGEKQLMAFAGGFFNNVAHKGRKK